MNDVNQTIIDAVVKKEEALCPDSLALIGVYGSVASGDAYEKLWINLTPKSRRKMRMSSIRR